MSKRVEKSPEGEESSRLQNAPPAKLKVSCYKSQFHEASVSSFISHETNISAWGFPLDKLQQKNKRFKIAQQSIVPRYFVKGSNFSISH